MKCRPGNTRLLCGYEDATRLRPWLTIHATGKKPFEQNCHRNFEMEKNSIFYCVPMRKKIAWLGKCSQSGHYLYFIDVFGKRTSSTDVTKIFILPFPCPGYQDMLLSQVNHNDKNDGYHGDSYSNHHWRHNWIGTSSCRTAWFGRVFIIGTGNNGAEMGNN